MSDQTLYDVETHYNVRIPVHDGLTLSANLWMPVAREAGETFPAILEMIPYRKDDWRYLSDHSRMTYLAQRGYVGCRLDVRGTGSSDGIGSDEYTPDETQDGYDAVEWLAAQPWCNGSVGMWGISYGGFTSIQVAMLRPPHLKAIVPVYATDDRYLDDVHYVGGCMVASEFAQYAVSQVGMNAMPPHPDSVADWAGKWKTRLEQTPPWPLEWLRHQDDGPYWRSGSLAPDYDRISCAVFNIGGWMDGYTNAALRMQAKCAAPGKTLVGNWVHSLPDSAYPGPNLDWLHEMVRFFDCWLKGSENGVKDEPELVYFRREYTEPEAFPARFNGEWAALKSYDGQPGRIDRLRLGAASLGEGDQAEGADVLRHRATHGTAAALCYGAGSAPSGLARDLRPDEATIPTYTSAPLDAPLDVLGFPEAVLYVSCTAPIAALVVRLTDVAPDGTSALVSTGVLNLTHRESHSQPEPIPPGEVFEARVPLKAAGYRFLPGHRIRVSVASGYWPVLWPTPYPAEITIQRGGERESRLELPVMAAGEQDATPPTFKLSAPELSEAGDGSYEPPVWQIVEDVIAGSVTVKVYDGDTSNLPGGRTIFTSERLEMTAFHHDPAHATLVNEVVYRLTEHGYTIDIHASGGITSTQTDFHVDVELAVKLNGAPFFNKSWLEAIPRHLL